MASKDRIQRQKEETRNSILDAAYAIVKEEGWEGLNMRKIADRIEYTAPIIYEYFANKQAIIEELTCKGHNNLTKLVKAASETETHPDKKLQAMWVAFWNFAFANKELYQVMFGVEMKCCVQSDNFERETTYQLFVKCIEEIMQDQQPTGAEVKIKYFTFFSVIHGLISVNMIGNGLSETTNEQIFKDAVVAITRSLYKQEEIPVKETTSS
ncbi:TetR/AcrR family transcriptional regulator [Sphingobacterium psychroaquaticum]|uniref:Transcriptional regulator, TetR family n=1 Tax=Sphingobacterium psychroaquaticum TaxID=561061 RepID=A0A1X7IC45_9SPHI|nr:TetR/AcrR family transcriptional regulator [Sphingobacterium psychroaquaticum]QBQ41724.1 TetR/AcrR family transcriptional regulator [Sphingobacterium psychroaquaticum]SMG11705.1 transcriptional regulator, TetR family [Sphingobacterium psychroaquaticum]